MRKILLFVTVLAGTCTGAWAQLRTSESSSRLLDECRTLFTQGDYSAAGSILEQWSRTDEAKGLARDEEIDFMRVVIQAENDLATAMPAIQIFMSEYPSSMYNNRLYALMGSSHFALHEYEDAIESLRSATRSCLTPGTACVWYDIRRSPCSDADALRRATWNSPSWSVWWRTLRPTRI